MADSRIRIAKDQAERVRALRDGSDTNGQSEILFVRLGASFADLKDGDRAGLRFRR